MDRSYRLYTRAAAVAFFLVTVYTVPTKLVQGRLGDDWFHSVLHLASGLLGAWCGWHPPGAAPARAFTRVVGLLYGALGVFGWFVDGLLLGTPLAVPLGTAENVFHLILGLPALALLSADVRRGDQSTRAAGRP